MARIASRGTLTASGDTTVDSTAQPRSCRVLVFNRDTVQHKYTFKIGTTELKELVLAAKDHGYFGPENAENGANFVVNVAEATTTSASTYQVTGEDDS
jgi:hypothetical protein